MADGTGIEWTDATWNPIRGCSRVSEGCRNCYAETVAARFSGPGQPCHELADRGRAGSKWTGEVRLFETVLDQPMRWRRPRRIFVNSMSDLFHEKLPDAAIDRIFAVMALSPQHTLQVLTKRSARMRAYLTDPLTPGRVAAVVESMRTDDRAVGPLPHLQGGERWWPLANVWLGVSVENQAAADERIPDLLATPAAKRFLSGEPLLGPVSLHPMDLPGGYAELRPLYPVLEGDFDGNGDPIPPRGRIDWVICGGESGPGARPMHPDWARSLRDQCSAAGVPFFFKQWGEWAPVDLDSFGAGNWHILSQDGSRDIPDDRTPEEDQGEVAIARVGKKAAGHLLDGVAHREFPA